MPQVLANACFIKTPRWFWSTGVETCPCSCLGTVPRHPGSWSKHAAVHAHEQALAMLTHGHCEIASSAANLHPNTFSQKGICGYTAVADSSSQHSKKRNQHINAKHPQDDSAKRYKRRSEHDLVSPVDMEPGSAAWQCFKCKKSLGAMPKTQLDKSARNHLSSCAPGTTVFEYGANLIKEKRAAGTFTKKSAKRFLPRSFALSNARIKVDIQKWKSFPQGHKLVNVQFPNVMGGRFLWTCSKCARTWNCVSEFICQGYPCAGRKKRCITLARKGRRWSKIRTGSFPFENLMKVWKLSKTEFETLERAMPVSTKYTRVCKTSLGMTRCPLCLTSQRPASNQILVRVNF